MTQNELSKWIKELIANDELYRFYQCRMWRKLAAAIMKENNYECQHCKQKGIHAAARSVHHVRYVREYPQLAMSRTYEYDGKTYNNLIPLCENCHNEMHGKGARTATGRKEKFMNEERW